MDKKYDTGKPMVGLMKLDFHLALIAVAEVTSYGVKKYNQPGSWRTVDNAFQRYEDALGRHDLQSTHEFHCEESGLTHLAHRAWNALATLQLMLEEREENLNREVGEEPYYCGLSYPVSQADIDSVCSKCSFVPCSKVLKGKAVPPDHDLVAESVTPLPELKFGTGLMTETVESRQEPISVYTWVCSNCGVKNDNSNIYTCQRCGHRRC